MSTLDAERALKVRKREVPYLKALAAREGILAAEGKGEPYTIDPVALQVWCPSLCLKTSTRRTDHRHASHS